MRNLLKYTVLVLFLNPFGIHAQKSKRYKYELIGGIGMTNFLGDLGGANQVGTHFVKDFEFLATRPMIYGGMRYKVHPYWGYKGMLNIGMLYGADRLTKEPFRNNRNLTFRSPIIELSGQVEFYFLSEKSAKVYSISGLKSGKKKKKISTYAFAGLGAFWFMPQGPYDGRWVNLRRLNTEGQGLPGGAKKYSNFSMCFPIGIGGKFQKDRLWSIGAEVGVRYTLTDYIDDVSTRYYDNNAIRAAYGDVAAAMADPSLGNIHGATLPDGSGQAAQRGNKKETDTYMFVTFNVGYKIAKLRKHRTRAKF